MLLLRATRLYRPDVVILKNYANEGYKLTLHRSIRQSGYELKIDYSAKATVNDEKLEVNLSRARSKLYEYAKCNLWEMFLTITLDPRKYDRFNLKKYNSDLNVFIKNYNRIHGLSIKRVLIPEEHKKGGWHMHGLIMGLPLNHLREFTLAEKLPEYIRKKLESGQKVYEWVAYRNKFGFNDFEYIKNKDACCKYITKYITKELGGSIKQLNAQCYYASKGLKTAEEIKRGLYSSVKEFRPQFENDYVKVAWFDKSTNLSDLLEYIND